MKWSKQIKVRLEYAIQFAKARAKTSSKVFKIAEGDYKPGTYTYKRKHSFADMSTRKHYPGLHRLTLIINGVERETIDFNIEQ